MSIKITDFSILDKFNFELPPVGIKYLSVYPPEGINKINEKMAICQMLGAAQKGNTFYATKNELTCVSPLLMGMVSQDPASESGRVGLELDYFNEPRVNKKIYTIAPRMPLGSVEYVVFSPLSKVSFSPDMIIILANAEQAAILVRASSYSSLNIWSGFGITALGCAWVFVKPFLSGEINFSISGVGIGKGIFPDGKIIISFPYDVIPELIDNLQHMNWVTEYDKLSRAEILNQVENIKTNIASQTEKADYEKK
jgi:uncharacterized protein (DUF169 family)